MRILVLGNDAINNELLAQGKQPDAEVVFIDELSDLAHHKADAIIDLLFQDDTERINVLERSGANKIMVHAMLTSAKELPAHFVRINAWPGFLERTIVEAAGQVQHEWASALMLQFGKKIHWAPDIPGFITARVVSMIINEAYFALDEKVSSKEDIDIAMKTGTNYPYGPFEWSERIGLKNISSLLLHLSETDKRYQPASLLQKTTASAWH